MFNGERNDKPNKKTQFIIKKDSKKFGENRDSNVVFEIKDITLGRMKIEGQYSYYNLRNLSNTETVEVLVRDSKETKKIDLPDTMLSRLAEYLKVEKNLTDYNFDCSAFAHFVNDIPHQFAVFDILDGKWEISNIYEKQPNPGETVLLLRTDINDTKLLGDPVHFAICIGPDLYISKFGTVGRLIATSAEEMKKAFDADNMVKVSPNKKYQNTKKVSIENYKNTY
jgi:hypothetical protein